MIIHSLQDSPMLVQWLPDALTISIKSLNMAHKDSDFWNLIILCFLSIFWHHWCALGSICVCGTDSHIKDYKCLPLVEFHLCLYSAGDCC